MTAESVSLRFDVAVFGAGSAGCIAAIAAARRGLRTVLVEKLPFPGGTSTAVLDTFYAFFTAGERGAKIVAGLPDLPVAQLRERNAVFERPNSFGSGLGYTYDPEMLKIVWARLLRANDVSVLLHSTVLDVVSSAAGHVEAVVVGSKAGIIELRAKAYVDSTGDADVAHLSGLAMQPDIALQQPATLTFRLTGVDIERYRTLARPKWKELLGIGRAQGFSIPGEGGSLHASGARGVVLTALTRIRPPDLNDPEEPGRVELDGLLQIEEWLAFLRSAVPGFEAATLVSVGTMAGVRETRRILGEYTLTEHDVVHGRFHDDQVALCGAPIEDLSHAETRWVRVGGAGAYGIPWRALVPRGSSNLAVAGRCMSATHLAHASARSMGTCMALGQAAGTAAAIVSRTGRDFSALRHSELSAELRRDGAILELGSSA
jgi:hypothetical protein